MRVPDHTEKLNFTWKVAVPTALLVLAWLCTIQAIRYSNDGHPHKGWSVGILVVAVVFFALKRRVCGKMP